MTDYDAGSPSTTRTAALETLRECTREIALYSDPQAEAEYVQLIASLHKKAGALRALYQHPQEDACVEKIVKLARKGLPPHNLSLPKALETLAECRARAGDRAAALALYQEALDARAAAGLPEAHPALTANLKCMADLHRDQQELDQALEVYGKVLSLRRSLLPDDACRRHLDPAVAEALHDLGTTYHLLAKFDQAIPFLKEALEMKRALLVKAARIGEEDEEEEEEVKDATVDDPAPGDDKRAEEEEEEETELLLEMMYSLASTYAKNAEYTLAQPLYRELIARRRNEDPPNYIKLARALNNAGAMHMEAGDGALALPFYEEALDIFRMVLPSDHPQVGTMHTQNRRRDLSPFPNPRKQQLIPPPPFPSSSSSSTYRWPRPWAIWARCTAAWSSTRKPSGCLKPPWPSNAGPGRGWGAWTPWAWPAP